MHGRACRLFRTLRIFSFSMLALSAYAFGQTEKILYEFNGGTGSSPAGNLIFDAAGNLYGTTTTGGSETRGAVYELSPAAGGGWTQTTLHSFTGGSDGSEPEAGLVFDATGNLYGTTAWGGVYGYGTVFELSPLSGGGWTEQVLYSFTNSTDGANPNGALTFDMAGNLYGTCIFGGAHDQGVVYELSPVVGGGWTENVILSGSPAHGADFFGSVVFDSSGNLYATASTDGSFNAGAIYRLRYTAGVWKASVIYTFQNGADGSSPVGLIYRAPNRFFGVTNGGGTYGYGTAYELTLGANGTWSKTILYNFGNSSAGALPPIFSLTVGPSGRLYSASSQGGSSGFGTAFALVQSAGIWQEKILHNFTINSDAGNPNGGVVLDGAGNLYGVGANGGTWESGAVYKITP